MRNDGIRRSIDADQAGQRAGVDAGDTDAAIGLHPGIKMLRAAEIRRIGHILTHDRAQRMGVQRLHILWVGTNIADMGKGEVDDLPGIGRIGHDLLIARHSGVEADFAHRLSFGAKAPTPDNLARRQYQYACRSGGRARRGGVGHDWGRSVQKIAAMSLRHRA